MQSNRAAAQRHLVHCPGPAEKIPGAHLRHGPSTQRQAAEVVPAVAPTHRSRAICAEISTAQTGDGGRLRGQRLRARFFISIPFLISRSLMSRKHDPSADQPRRQAERQPDRPKEPVHPPDAHDQRNRKPRQSKPRARSVCLPMRTRR